MWRLVYTLTKGLAALLTVLCLIMGALGVSSLDRRVALYLGGAAAVTWLVAVACRWAVPPTATGVSIPSLDRLLEWLIVIIVILVLVAIAVPGYKGSSVRPRVRQTKATLREIGTAVEQYGIRHGTCRPPDLAALTTPVGYLPEVHRDPFASGKASFRYLADGRSWIASSVGPDGRADLPATVFSTGSEEQAVLLSTATYDPTNGSVSKGDILTAHIE